MKAVVVATFPVRYGDYNHVYGGFVYGLRGSCYALD
jgi:hypothetical protein